jgi:hypothetical protein
MKYGLPRHGQLTIFGVDLVTRLFAQPVHCGLGVSPERLNGVRTTAVKR